MDAMNIGWMMMFNTIITDPLLSAKGAAIVELFFWQKSINSFLLLVSQNWKAFHFVSLKDSQVSTQVDSPEQRFQVLYCSIDFQRSTSSVDLKCFQLKEINCFSSKVPFSWRWKNLSAHHWRRFTWKFEAETKQNLVRRGEIVFLSSYSRSTIVYMKKSGAIRASNCSLSVSKQRDFPAAATTFTCWHSQRVLLKAFKGRPEILGPSATSFRLRNILVASKVIIKHH